MFTVTLAELMDRADTYLQAGQPDPPAPNVPALDAIAQELWQEASQIIRRTGPVIHALAVWQYEGPPEEGAVPFLYHWVADEFKARSGSLPPGDPRQDLIAADLERELSEEEGIPLAREIRVNRTTPLPPPLPSDN